MVLLSALIVPFAMLASWKIERTPKPLFRADFVFGSRFVRYVYRAEFFPLVHLLGTGPDSGVFPDQNLGRPQAHPGREPIFHLYAGRQRGDAPGLSRHLRRDGDGERAGLFDFGQLAERARNGGLDNALFAKLGGSFFKSKETLATVIFLGVFLGFAVKAPLMPFHTWLPSAYAEAPTGTSMLLTGAMSKMGVYGFLRILLPLFPAHTRALQTPLLILAVVTIVFSAAAALAQRDLKRMVAYSSINHVGYCLLGIFAAVQLDGGFRRLGHRQGRRPQRRHAANVQPRLDGLGPVLFCRPDRAAQRRPARPGRFWRPAQSRAGILRIDGHHLVRLASVCPA